MGAGTAEWQARYKFGDEPRDVHNKLTSVFKIRNGLITDQNDQSNALRWAWQALGSVKGVVSGLYRPLRETEAKKKLADFRQDHPTAY